MPGNTARSYKAFVLGQRWPQLLDNMITEVGYTPSGNRVTIEMDQRVEGPGPHVFVYTEGGRRYRVGVGQGRTARETANDLVSGEISDRWITE